MIIRVVRMTFEIGKEEEFLRLFDLIKEKIIGFEGCQHLELLRDVNNRNVFTTYSHWQSEEKLNAYRDSALFADTWSKTKKLFADRPVAHSYEQVK